jgi:hypothetical protein
MLFDQTSYLTEKMFLDTVSHIQIYITCSCSSGVAFPLPALSQDKFLLSAIPVLYSSSLRMSRNEGIRGGGNLYCSLTAWGTYKSYKVTAEFYKITQPAESTLQIFYNIPYAYLSLCHLLSNLPK